MGFSHIGATGPTLLEKAKPLGSCCFSCKPDVRVLRAPFIDQADTLWHADQQRLDQSPSTQVNTEFPTSSKPNYLVPLGSNTTIPVQTDRWEFPISTKPFADSIPAADSASLSAHKSGSPRDRSDPASIVVTAPVQAQGLPGALGLQWSWHQENANRKVSLWVEKRICHLGEAV